MFPYSPAPASVDHWHGTLLADKRDASGLLYRRNRYYDPATGRFTQEDPIGLAGGVNVYGFAAGDPVSYSDPYGLCPIPPSSCIEAVERLQGRLLQAALTAAEVVGEVSGVAPLMRAFSGEDAHGNRLTAGRRMFEGGLVVAGALSGAGDDLARAAALADRGGFTLAGRALAKHGSREGSAFVLPRGNPSAINAAAQQI
ncbi:MAG: RHS repeat-associated core domain-containing protein, partial [Thioalkalivibrio sp.]|nr:RHS repeat-associated core domain-containing protein [Thioalkalivibrio sp.]